jgi:hypothetical protein
VGLGRLSNGERISSASAILLFVFMFFHWFGVKAVNTSNLLFAIEAGGPGKSAWEALDYIPIVLVIAIIAALAVSALRFTNAVRKPSVPVNAVVAILGFVSALLILCRIVDPPIFLVEQTVTLEGAAQLPIFLALAAATGITFGGCLAMWEEGVSFRVLRALLSGSGSRRSGNRERWQGVSGSAWRSGVGRLRPLSRCGLRGPCRGGGCHRRWPDERQRSQGIEAHPWLLAAPLAATATGALGLDLMRA